MSHSHMEKGNNCVLKSDHFCLSVIPRCSLAPTVKLNYSLEEKDKKLKGKEEEQNRNLIGFMSALGVP